MAERKSDWQPAVSLLREMKEMVMAWMGGSGTGGHDERWPW